MHSNFVHRGIFYSDGDDELLSLNEKMSRKAYIL